jgi:hypothetical protein
MDIEWKKCTSVSGVYICGVDGAVGAMLASATMMEREQLTESSSMW